MIKFLFLTDYVNAPSTMLNISLLKQLNDLENITIDFFNNQYQDYDVVLFMGYDPKIIDARLANPNIKVGIIDPRPSFGTENLNPDFILANGIEMKDWYSRITPNIYVYNIYPSLQYKFRKHESSDKVIIGYHGNKVHLPAMYPRITLALDALADLFQIEFYAMYNIEKLGSWTLGLPNAKKIKVKHIQWSENNYEKYLSRVDVGIVPNLLPIKNLKKSKKKAVLASSIFREHEEDYLIRYKPTSNSGRIFPFVQYGIPVVSDMFPSALQMIRDGYDGFVCYSSSSWYLALKKLIEFPEQRNLFAERMFEKFITFYSPEALNLGLVEFINNLQPSPPPLPLPLTITGKSCLDSPTYRFQIKRSRIIDILSLGKRGLKKLKIIFRNFLGNYQL
jgi:glycosyltransferase involved in cell wall biosynthesis